MAMLRLLIVDDDKSLVENLRIFFERHQCQVEAAHDGLRAVEMAEQFRPNLMFLDIGLPRLSGIEVLRQVKAKDPTIRIIMITGQAEEEIVAQARQLGADDYVHKPFSLEYLNGEVLGKLHRQLFQDLRSASQDLEIEREKAELLFKQVSEGVILFDQRGFVYVANPCARVMLGLPEDLSDWTAQKVFESFKMQQTPSPSMGEVAKTAGDSPDVWRGGDGGGSRLKGPPTSVLPHKGGGCLEERFLDRPNGEPFDLVRETPKMLALECRVTPILTSRNERAGHLLLFRDVTMDRKAETAMHHFIALISHKLRTPLVTIRAYPRLLLDEDKTGALNEFQRNALETIDRQCQALAEMMNQLIAFSSLDPEELLRQRMSLWELAHEALKLLPEERQPRPAQVRLEESLKALFVNVDPTLLRHAIRNVLENAFKFGAKQVRVGGQEQEGKVTLSVRDDGPGIPPEDRQRVFERFYQVERSFCGQVPGVGLGLTMVKAVVEAHGGQVWVESRPDEGSTFFIRLPAVP